MPYHGLAGDKTVSCQCRQAAVAVSRSSFEGREQEIRVSSDREARNQASEGNVFGHDPVNFDGLGTDCQQFVQGTLRNVCGIHHL